jgi:hydroxymethylpyrimidine/phosphomethylpyrimidine kinase
LVIGGFDGSSGAGVSADLCMVQRMGGYGVAALTALTIQDHEGFSGSSPIDAQWIRRQIGWLLDHYVVKAVKIGMLGRAEAVRAVADALLPSRIPLVLDPVLRSTSGVDLLDGAGLACLVETLLPAATLITPNLVEAELLCPKAGKGADTEALARLLSRRFATAVLVKGGHAQASRAQDLLLEKSGGLSVHDGPRVAGVNGHGTGCRLASAVATGLALGYNLRDAVARAKTAQNGLFLHPLELDGFGPVLG